MGYFYILEKKAYGNKLLLLSINNIPEEQKKFMAIRLITKRVLADQQMVLLLMK